MDRLHPGGGNGQQIMIKIVMVLQLVETKPHR